MSRLDKWLINKLQALYLWAFDWTGVYVGTICVLLVIIGNASVPFINGNATPGTIAFFVAIGLPNLRALALRDLSYRFYASLFLMGWAVSDILVWKLWGQIINFPCLILWMYMTTIMIRDREPKEWFKKHSLVMDGAG